jgi:hypothetical protein
MKIIKNKINYILLGMLLMFSFSCDDFVDINADPNNPTVPQLNLLLPSTQLSIVGSFDQVNRGASAVVQHRGSGSLNRYDQTGSTFQNTWFGYYTSALPDLNTMIKTGTAQQAWGYVSIAKIQKAFLFGMMVDLWGDIPYFEAGQSPDPAFDDGALIYEDLLALIDEALLDMEKSFTVSSSADFFYQGSKEKWQKMANSLKLKLYLQSRKDNPNRSAREIAALIQEGNLINSNEDNFTFLFGTNTAPNSRHPWYTEGYAPGRDGYVSMVVVDRLKAQDDPRLRYYIFRLNENSGVGNSSVGEGYYGRYPGDGTSSPADNNTRAIVGIYPSGGVYDNGRIPSLPSTNEYLTNEGAVTGTTSNSFKSVLFAQGDGTGAGIQPLLTHAMVKFYRAEAALTLETGEDAGLLMKEAVRAQMEEINGVSPAFPLSANLIDSFTDELVAEFSSVGPEGQLKLVMTQKWIAMYGNGVESYNDFRRTGLPQLEDLMAPLDLFPERLFYSDNELNTNETVVQIREELQRNQQITPVFWRK